jgi:hypothetical protein
VTAPARLLFALLLLVGCDRRKPIAVKGDGGPSVVVVDPIQKTSQPVPLVDESEPNDDVAHAQPIEQGKGIRGTVGEPKVPTKKNAKPGGDEDVYSFLAPGTPSPDGGTEFDELRVELSGVPGIDLQLEALDGDGKRLVVVNDAAAGEGEVIANLGIEPGHTYYVKVKSLTPQKGDKPYELVLRSGPAPAGDEREPNDDAAHATRLPALSDASGFFGRRRDEDWLLLPPSPMPGILRIELGPVDGVAPELKLVSGDPANPKSLQPMLTARAGKGDELRLRNAPAPATPTFLVVRTTDGRNTDIRWSLKLGVEPALDGAEKEPNDTVATATPLVFNGAAQVAGFLWPGDADVYHVTGVPADGLATCEVEGVERVDLKLERIGPDGKPLVKADDAGVGKGEQLPPWPGGDFFVRVSARARDSAFDAPYRLTIGAQPGEPDLEREPNDSPALATPFAPSGTMRGYLAPKNDVDYFKFVAPPAHTKATVEVTGPVPAQARITDESKLPLGPTAPITAGKTYYIAVKANSDKSANAKDPYTVTLRLE